jgi:PqqD family protein of HPr-rel-A system
VISPADPRWRLPSDQRLVFEDFDDGILVFDARVGGTHLVNATAAEALEVVTATPGLTASEIHRRVLERLGLDEAALPLPAVEELLRRLADLCLVTTSP